MAKILEDAFGWTFVIALDDLWDGEMVGVRVGRTDVLVVNLGAEGIRAYDNRCPHAGTRLSEGHLEAGTLRCAAHLWEFEVRSGAGINPRNCRLRAFPVKVVEGRILVRAEGGC